MKLIFASVVLAVFAAVGESKVLVCETDQQGKLNTFLGYPVKMLMPCKYWAVQNQKCGNYLVTLSPGNQWVGTRYYLNTLWMGVEDTRDPNIYWKGRTTNRIVFKVAKKVKGLNETFNPKNNSVDANSIFNFNWHKTQGACWAAKDDSFKVCFRPWHPEGRKDGFVHSSFRLECLANDDELRDGSQQFCGDMNIKLDMKERAKSLPFNLPQDDKFYPIMHYYDVFTNPDIEQVDQRCIEAVDVFKTCGDDDRKMMVLKNCHQILSSDIHTECVNLFSCHPMDVFNDCLRWGCAGEGFEKSERDLCKSLGETIDSCKTFASTGNLTDRIKAANCLPYYYAPEE